MKSIKELFLKNIKSIPIEESEINQETYLQDIYNSVLLFEKGQKKEAYSQILTILEVFLREKKYLKYSDEKITKMLLLISEIPNLDNNLKDFSLDCMIVLEWTKSPDDKVVETLLETLFEIKKALTI